jgi:hypothetical protein
VEVTAEDPSLGSKTFRDSSSFNVRSLVPALAKPAEIFRNCSERGLNGSEADAVEAGGARSFLMSASAGEICRCRLLGAEPTCSAIRFIVSSSMVAAPRW